MVWSLQMESGTTEWHWCSSCAQSMSSRMWSFQPEPSSHCCCFTGFLAAIALYSLLLYGNNRSHMCNKILVKLRRNVFNLFKPFPIKWSQFSNETHAVCKAELWEFFSKAGGGGPAQGCRVALWFAVCTRLQGCYYPVLQAKQLLRDKGLSAFSSQMALGI